MPPAGTVFSRYDDVLPSAALGWPLANIEDSSCSPVQAQGRESLTSLTGSGLRSS